MFHAGQYEVQQAQQGRRAQQVWRRTVGMRAHGIWSRRHTF